MGAAGKYQGVSDQHSFFYYFPLSLCIRKQHRQVEQAPCNEGIVKYQNGLISFTHSLVWA